MLKADYRNQQRQSFCARKACQRLRRTLGQKLRRQAQQAARPSPKHPRDRSELRSRPQKASLISPPDIRAENPVIVGLISMITGSTNLEDIAATHRQLWIRGQQILAGTGLTEADNPRLINIFHALEQSAGRGS